MTAAGDFIAQLQKERRGGNISGETEQHLKHEFRKHGWHALDTILASAIGSEIDRLEREAVTLRKLRAAVFGVALVASEPWSPMAVATVSLLARSASDKSPHRPPNGLHHGRQRVVGARTVPEVLG